MPAWAWVLIAVAVLIVIAMVAWTAWKKDRSRRLQDHFGPEYDRTLEERGDRHEAEAALRDRADQRAQLDIRPLSQPAIDRYREEWRTVQARFVDDPNQAVGDADRLVTLVMSERGYPMDDFDRQAELISVDHPQVVEDYRKGHAIYTAFDRGESGTEDLRQAIVHYRSLFGQLLETEHDIEPAGKAR